MPRIFSFERELHATLDLMPLAIRRKLDLAGVKLSLDGWQAMAIADRRALVEAEVGDDASLAAFAASLRAAAERAVRRSRRSRRRARSRGGRPRSRTRCAGGSSISAPR